MKLKLSKRQSTIPEAATMAAAARARALRAEGRDIVSLTLGEPDFASPHWAVEAAYAAGLRGETKYPPVSGVAGLKEAVAAAFLAENKLEYGVSRVLVGNGARQIIFDAMMALLDEGDEVVVPAPYWNAYPLIARMMGAKPVFVACKQAEGFLPDPARLRKAISRRTKILVLNYPNNPTGAVCPAAHLREIAAVVRKAPHVWVLADEMYGHLVHDGSRNPSFAAEAPDLFERVLTVSGVSKTYAMTGWRVGFAGGPAPLIAAMTKVQGQSTGGVSPIAQAAALAALTGPRARVAEMREAYARRTARVAAALNEVPGLDCALPAGAFYLFPNVAGWLGRRTAQGRRLETDEDVASALLEEAGVAVVHGASFGLSPHLRLSTAASDAALDQACARIAAFSASLG